MAVTISGSQLFVAGAGALLISPEECIDILGVTGPEAVKGTDALIRVGPMPVVDWLRIEYELASAEVVGLRVIDPSGRVVRDLSGELGHTAKGVVSWDRRDRNGRRVPRGAYWLELVGKASRATRKLVVLD